MTTKFLQTEQEYLAALKEVSPLFDLDSAEDDRFLELCTAIQDYEKRHFPEFNVNIIKYTICIHQAENGDHSGFVPDITA